MCDSNSKKMFGCSMVDNRERTPEPVFSHEYNGKIYRFFQCPFSVISKETVDFIIKYNTFKRFSNAPNYEKMTKRFIEQCNIYENGLSELQEE